MARLSAEQIAKVAYDAGFRGDALVTMVAIALAESNGRTDALNAKAPDYSVGLWQINYYGGLRAERTKRYGPPEALYDPAANARAAFDISAQGKNFKPWSVYTNGSYRPNLTVARSAVASVGGEAALATAESPATQQGAAVPPTAQQTQQDISGLEWMLADPELGDILRKYERGEINEQQRRAAIQNTDWFKKNNAEARRFFEKRNTDPQAAEQELQDLARKIVEQGAALGRPISMDEARRVGEQMLTLGLDEVERGAFLEKEFGLVSRSFKDFEWMRAVPELAALLDQAMNSEPPWSATTLRAAISRTNWYRTTPPAQRSAIELRGADPAAYQDTVTDTVDAVRRQAVSLGINLPVGAAERIAGELVAAGNQNDPNAMDGAIVRYFDPNATLGGETATNAEQLAAFERNYGVEMSTQQRNLWLQDLLVGRTTVATIEQWFKDQAKSLYPSIAAQIDAGQTPLAYAGQYIRLASNILEIPEDTLDLNSPLVKQGLSTVVDEQGNRLPMGMWEYERWLRRRPEYDKTKQATENASQVAQGLGDLFGLPLVGIS